MNFIAEKICKAQTVAELTALENQHTLNEFEQGLMFDRKVEIISRLLEWGAENERVGLTANLSDYWTPEQRQQFMMDWQDDEPLLQNERLGLASDLMDSWTLEQRENFMTDWLDDEPLLQVGRGQKKSIDEVNDGAGTSEQVSDNFFTVSNVKQVKVKKFNATGMDYTVQLMDTFAHLELSQYHDRLHEIFESLLNTVTQDIPMQDQVRFVLQSPQLETPISLPFLPRQPLTTERVLAEIERVIQSNHEFRLNDSVNVNLIHVEMPNGGTGTKRSEINLEKHLINKRSIVRIQNKDDICLARALVVSIAKSENDSRYYHIINHKRPLQARLARDLHQKAGVEIGSCGLDEVKLFQTYLSDYQINIVSKEHQNSIIFSGPEKDKMIYLFLHDNHYDVITNMPAFFARKRYCHTCKKGYDKMTDHLCADACKSCRFPNCPIVSWLPCADCMRVFKSQECFDRHKQTAGNAKSICASLVKCFHCGFVVKRGRLRRHHCGLTRCSTCKEYVRLENHQCYMQLRKRETRPSARTLTLMTINHQVSIRFTRSIFKRLHEVIGMFRKHLSGKCRDTK